MAHCIISQYASKTDGIDTLINKDFDKVPSINVGTMRVLIVLLSSESTLIV